MLVPYIERDPLSSGSAFNCRHQIAIEIKVLGLPRLGTARAAWGSTEATFRTPPNLFPLPGEPHVPCRCLPRGAVGSSAPRRMNHGSGAGLVRS